MAKVTTDLGVRPVGPHLPQNSSHHGIQYQKDVAMARRISCGKREPPSLPG